MSSWAIRRQVTYVAVIASIILLVTAFVGYILFNRVPSCFDGIQNGSESEIDCGGVCLRVCAAQAVAPRILWQRIFPANTDQGLWSVVAEIENPNSSSSIQKIGYLFKIYDIEGVPIGEKSGFAAIPANSISPIFESYIPTGKHVPVRVTFEFTSLPEWIRVGERVRDIDVSAQNVENESSAPRVSALIKNQGLRVERDIEVVAIVYDSSGNAVAASRTIVDSLEKNEESPIAFTWRMPFTRAISRIEIVPKYDPYIEAESR